VGTLYLVATPIGNLEDITLRALRILSEASLIAAEDSRHTRGLLNHFEIKTPMLSYHEHNKLVRIDEILVKLSKGTVALVSDAGTPGLSDPGYELVRAAIEAGYNVSPIPGPSAPIAALVASGLPTDTFVFVGYLPRKQRERVRFLQELAHEKRTIIAFESPHRLSKSVIDLAQVFGSDRPVVLCREMTKLHEEFDRGSLGELVDRVVGENPKGEVTLIIGGDLHSELWDEQKVRSAVQEHINSGRRPSEIAREIAEVSGWKRRDVYRITQEDK
jgi:16S rRNA (cytidine1402-2'-O)-methyltransferase